MSSEHSARPSGSLIPIFVGLAIVLVISVFLLAKLATSGKIIDASVMSKESIAARIKPAGESVAGDGAAPGSRSGEAVYKAICSSCHDTGLIDSPKFGDSGAWAPRLAQGFDTLVNHAINGLRAMPPRGGASDLTDDEVARAVAYLGNSAGANFKAPEAGGAEGGEAAAGGETAAADPAAVGKKIYDTACVACHAAGVAGAPILGDKAAWAPRIAKGLDALVESGIKGLNAMPPKGTFTGSDEDFKASVEYMVNQSK